MLSGFKNEMKQQGAEEAARDPSSSVTAADAERVIMDESKKAGAVALSFDPNATPEEKARQAKARTNNTKGREPKGMGIATDLDDGTPDQYNLPPPSTKGALAAPEPGAKQANGAPPEDDNWGKAGWEPRFGSGEKEGDTTDDRNLLDHQTFLEANLDEKFFGDWYHNTAVIIFACLSSWVIALVGGGLAWVALIMVCCGTYYRTSLRRVRRNFRDDITREMAKARLENDHESLEWINSFLVKFWPIYAPQLAMGIIQSVDQVLSTSTPAFLDSMRLKTFTLGTKPPRLEHVKTYPRTEDEIVMMDWKFSFTPTDTLDMTARQLKNKVNPKVVLEVRVGKAMISKGMDIIVEDFAFSGLMRIKMKLQIPFPHIDRVDICFLGRPDIDYVCKPLGGDTFGFDINFIPGLEGFIKEQVHANLGPMMYAPNVFPIEVAKMLSGNPIDTAIGVVAVTLHGANGLKNPDKFSGTPDPYVVLSLNNSKELGRTKTVHENANPKWNETIYIIVTNYTDALTLTTFDYNEVRKDKELGVSTFPLDKLEADPEHENLQLEVLAGGKPRGVLQADIRFFPVLESQKLEDGSMAPPPESNTGIARLTIEQAKELDGSKSMIGQLNPYGILLINGKEVHITSKLKRTNNPVFPNPTKSILITDRKKARVGLVLKDDRDLATDPVLGSYQVRLDDMIKLMDKGQEWFSLHGTKTGRAKLMLEWKPVALKGVAGGSGGYITPIGVMRIHVQGASDLRNFETLGKSDPYARLLLSGIIKGRTVTFQNNLNPTWDEVIYVPMHSTNERLTLEVMDEENLGKDRSLGQVEILASEYIKDSDEGGYLVHDTKSSLADGLRMNGQGQAKGKVNYTVSFFPTMNVIDPEEEEEERKAKEEMDLQATPATPSHSKNSSVEMKTPLSRPSVDGRKSLETAGRLSISKNGAPASIRESINGSANGSLLEPKKEAPKIRIESGDLSKYECGLIVFKIVEGTFAKSDVMLEVLMDDHVFPSYVSSKAKGRSHQFGETGDAFVRELDMSKITVRLVEKSDASGKNDDEDHVVAKLSGQTHATLQQCLYKPTELTMKHSDGQTSKVTFQMRYLPVHMTLDPSESINNMGTLRVDVLDADDLPSADRNGFSDPYCKFKLNGKDVFKTKVQKKTLHPAWNEYFEVPIPSRTGADFKCDVYDWDFGDKADFLGSTKLNLEVLEPFQPQELHYALDGKSGALRLKMLFRPDYVTRQRQGTSTFSGTFAPAGKVVGAPVKGVGKVGGVVGGGVMKGASFLKRGFTGRGGSKDEPMVVNGTSGDVTAESPSTPGGTPARSAAVAEGAATPTTPSTPHARTKSSNSIIGGTPKGPDAGTANFIIVQAAGYPPSADVRVHVKMLGAKGAKELFKTRAIKSNSGVVEYDPNHENFKVNCSADAQFQISVKDKETFKDKDLGEGMLFVSDQGSGSEQQVKAGPGLVTVRSSFTPASSGYADSLKPTTSNGRDSPDSKREARRSFFGKRDASGKHDPPKE